MTEKGASLYITLDSFSLSDRLLRIESNSSIDTDLEKLGQDFEVRAWIGKSYKEEASKISTTTAQGGSTAEVTVTFTPRFGTPVGKIGQSSTLITGTMSGESGQFPFDEYSASINGQTDFDTHFRFEIENHLKDYELQSYRGGAHTANIVLQREPLTKLIPFIPLGILLIYSSWVAFLLFRRKESKDSPLVSNVALFIGILSLRAVVVPNEIRIPCAFDLGLILPTLIIFIGIIVHIRARLRFRA